MSDNIKITVEVNGGKVPLSSISDETIRKIKGQEEKELGPVFSKTNNRLIVRLAPRVLDTMREVLRRIEGGILLENQFMSFESDGLCGSYNIGHTWEEAKNFYSIGGVKPLF